MSDDEVRAGRHTRKRFGQHFLVPDWAEKLVAVIEPQPDDRFLEIGPGAGALTLRLAPRVAHVTAVEIDRDLATRLGPALPPNVDLITADFLTLDLDPLLAGGPLRVAGNLPYYVTSPILRRLVETWRIRRMALQGESGAGGSWRDATLMVQREVASRIQATAGSRDYGPLAIAIQLHADVRRVLTLPPNAFRPAPKVYSAVVRLTFRDPAVLVQDELLFEQMVRSVFTERRKTLANALGRFAWGRHADPEAALEAAGIDGRRRAETLQLPELARLADFFSRQGT